VGHKKKSRYCLSKVGLQKSIFLIKNQSFYGWRKNSLAGEAVSEWSIFKLLTDMRSDILDFLRSKIPFSSFFLIFFEIGQGFMRLQIVAIPNIGVIRANFPPI